MQESRNVSVRSREATPPLLAMIRSRTHFLALCGLGLFGVRLAFTAAGARHGCGDNRNSPLQTRATSAQMLPALAEDEEYTGKVYRVRSDTDMKSLADHVVREAGFGLATDSLGIKAASVVVKACATAMTADFNGDIIAMSLDWVTKKPHGRAFKEGAMDVTALRTLYRLVPKPEPQKQSPLLVGRNTNVGQLGGAILGRIKEAGEAQIHVAGPERTMSALRSVIAADRLWSVDPQNDPEKAPATGKGGVALELAACPASCILLALRLPLRARRGRGSLCRQPGRATDPAGRTSGRQSAHSVDVTGSCLRMAAAQSSLTSVCPCQSAFSSVVRSFSEGCDASLPELSAFN